MNARAGRGSGERTGFLTDPRRNAGAHSIAIVQVANEPQSADELHYCSYSMAASDVDAIGLAAAKLGFVDLKREQREVVEAFIGGNDVFAALPTGSGKSLCFAVLPLVRLSNVCPTHPLWGRGGGTTGDCACKTRPMGGD